MRGWWPEYDVQVRHGGCKRLRPPGGERADFVYNAFHLAEQSELTLVIYSEESQSVVG